MIMPGFYHGYLEGLTKISGIQAMQNQSQMDQLRIAQQRQSMDNSAQEQNLLKQAFSAKTDLQTIAEQINGQDRIAQMYMKAGQSIMHLNPKDGMALMRTAEEHQQKTALAGLETVKAESEKEKLAGTISANVDDQDSLNLAVSKLAKLGRMVPAKYRTWNSDTKDWFERQSKLGMSAHEQQRAAIELEQLRLKQRDEDRKIALEESKVRTEASREARLSQGLQIKQRASANKASAELGMKTGKDRETELKILSDLDSTGGFKALPAGKQLEAAEDVHMRAQKIYAESLVAGDEDPISKEDALRMARQEVIREIEKTPGGFFSKDTADRKVGGVEKKEPGQPVNIKTEADYAALPSGAVYVAPDGVVRRKK